MRRFLLISLIAALAGCNNAPKSPAAASFMNAHWSVLDDGSFVTRVGEPTGRNKAVMRCWPDEAGFNCIKASENTATGAQSLTVTIESGTDLPDFVLPIPSEGDGYSCRHLINTVEEVSRSGKVSISNTLNGSAGDRWSRDYVDSYLSEHGYEGSRWFSCLDTLAVLRAGGLATMETSTIRQDVTGLK